MAQQFTVSVFVLIALNAILTNGGSVVPSVMNSNGPVRFAASLRAPRHFCGGTIIGEQWIITAARCFSREDIDQSKVKAVLGTDAFNRGGESYDVESVIVHPKYNRNHSKTEYDMALIKTSKPIEMNENVTFLPMSKKTINSGVSVYTETWVPTRVSFYTFRLDVNKIIFVFFNF